MLEAGQARTAVASGCSIGVTMTAESDSRSAVTRAAPPRDRAHDLAQCQRHAVSDRMLNLSVDIRH